MKKILATLSATLLLVSCSQSDADPRIGMNMQLTGEIRDLGQITSSKAGHLLVSDDGETFYVYSDFIELSKPKYLDSHVIINGKVITIDDSGKETLLIESIVPLEEEAIERDTKGDIVKNYQNIESGFRLSNLVNWNLEEESEVVTRFSKDGSQFEITRFDNTTGLTLLEWIELAGATNFEPITFGKDNLKAYRIESDESLTYFVSRTNSYIFELTLTFDSLKQKQELLTVAKTFRFIPLKEDMSEVKTTESESSYNYADVSIYENTVLPTLPDLLPDYGGKDFEVYKVEFVKPAKGEERNYAYISYKQDGSRFKVLVSYVNNKPAGNRLEAYFEKGDIVDFKLVDGVDVTKNNESMSIYLSQGLGALNKKDGMKLFESSARNFLLQYKDSWYIQGVDGRYVISSAPNMAGKVITLSIIENDYDGAILELPYSFEKATLSHKDAHVYAALDTNTTIYLVSFDSMSFLFETESTNREVMEDVIQTLYLF